MSSSLTALRSLRTALKNIHARSLHSTARRHEQFLNANSETFAKAISSNRSQDKVVLVDFYADWCNPCKMLSPILEKLADDPSLKSGSGRSIDLVTVDTDSEFELSSHYKVRSLPTVVAFKDGKPVNQFIGALNEAGVRKFIQAV